MVVALEPGATGGMAAASGKQLFVGQPTGLGVGAQSTTKSCGRVPVFFRVSVTFAAFWELRILGENVVSLTVSTNVAVPPLRPS